LIERERDREREREREKGRRELETHQTKQYTDRESENSLPVVSSCRVPVFLTAFSLGSECICVSPLGFTWSLVAARLSCREREGEEKISLSLWLATDREGADDWPIDAT
jgi:hypothetical protein